MVAAASQLRSNVPSSKLAPLPDKSEDSATTLTRNDVHNDVISKRGPPMPTGERQGCRRPCERCPEMLHWLRDDRTMLGHANDTMWDTSGFGRSSKDTCVPLAHRNMHQTDGRSSESEGKSWRYDFGTWEGGPRVDVHTIFPHSI